MNKNLIVLVVSVLILMVAFSGCTDDIGANCPDEFVGTWTGDFDVEITFFKDGDCSYLGGAGTWEVKDGKLVIDEGQDIRRVFDYEFSNDNKHLELTISGDTYTYHKQ